MRSLFTAFTLLLSSFLFSEEIPSEENLLRRVNDHLLIGDSASALVESRKALILYPGSLPLLEVSIKTLAEVGLEREMLSKWKEYQEKSPGFEKKRDLIEEMAWGVLNKASNSSSLPVRQMSLLAAFFSQDRKGVRILQKGMRDSNYSIRAFSVKFSAHLRDQMLIDEIKRLFIQEKNYMVRLELLKAIGSMKIRSLENKLKSIIASSDSLPSEKAAGIASLIQLWDEINRCEIEILAKSDRAGLRELAAEAIAFFQSNRDIDLLLLLTRDSNPQVRVAAFYAIGQLRPWDQKEEIVRLTRGAIEESNGDSSLSAAWLLTLYEKEEGLRALRDFLGKPELEAKAVAALNHTGPLGIELMLETFYRVSDPVTKLNLALGLICQQAHFKVTLPYIREFLCSYKGLLGRKKEGFFDGFTSLQHHENLEDLLNTPEMENQIIRLELLGLLAAYDDPYAQESAKLYLQERSWGITATASALLLTEGDDGCVPLVEELLEDPNPAVRLQAAFVLSLFTREESVIKILEEQYQKGDWDLKVRVLESIGRIASFSSLPFLINQLGEEAQSLRLITAVAIIQTLNH